MFCPFCGNEVQSGMSFCPSCGKNISQFNNTQKPVDTPAPTEPIKDKQPVTKAVAKPAEVTPANEQYDVILTKIGRDKINIIKIIQVEYKVTLAEATNMIKTLPIVVQTTNSIEVANELASTLALLGAKATVEKRTEASSFEANPTEIKVVSNATPIPKQEDIVEQVAEEQPSAPTSDKSRSKFKAGLLLKMFGSIASIIASLSILFMPLFISLISLFNLCYINVMEMVENGFSIYNFYGILYLIIGISLVCILITSIVNLIKQICILANLDEHYKRELARQTSTNIMHQIGSIKYKQQNQNWIGIITDILIICFLVGFKYVLTTTLVITGIFLIANIVLDKVGSFLIGKMFDIK